MSGDNSPSIQPAPLKMNKSPLTFCLAGFPAGLGGPAWPTEVNHDWRANTHH